MNSEQADRRAADERKEIYGRLATIGDRSVRLESLRPQIESVTKYLREKLETESAENFESVASGLKRCGVELVHKAPIYAVIAGLLTCSGGVFAKNLGARLCEDVQRQVVTTLREGNAARARRAVRFLVCLSCASVVSVQSVVDYLRVLLKGAHEEMTTAGRSEKGVHARGIFLADIAVSALPWGAKHLSDAAPEEFAEIMTTAHQIFQVWTSGMWRSIASSTTSVGSEVFADIVEAVKELEQNDWEVDETLIPAFYKEFVVELVDGQNILLPDLSIPAHSKLTKYSPPRFRLRLVLEDNDVEMSAVVTAKKNVDMNGGGKVEKTEAEVESKDAGDAKDEDVVKDESVVKDENVVKEEPMTDASAKDESMEAVDDKKPKSTKYLRSFVKSLYVGDIVDNFPQKHQMAAERLLTMPMLSNSNNEVVEGLFSAMCSMPLAPYACVYYGILFVDLCKVKDSRLPVKLLSAVETMFQQSGALDPETFDRLTDWFAFHLSNFGYKWNWSDWAIYADAEMVEKFPFRALFCKDVLSRCIRLAYFSQIEKMIPEEMKFFLPPTPGRGNTSRFSEEVNKSLMEIVTGSQKQPPPIVRQRLINLFPASDNEDPDTLVAEDREANYNRLTALLRSILMAGYKTLSHFDTVAHRYVDLLKEMAPSNNVDARRRVVQEVSVFWDSSHLRRMYVLDKLSSMRVIDGLAVLDNVLSAHRFEDGAVVAKTSEELVKELAQSGVWEMVRSVLMRARSREEITRLEMMNASRAAAAATEGDMESIGKRLEEAKKETEIAKNDIKQLLLLAMRRLFEMTDVLLSETAVGMLDGDEDPNPDKSLPGTVGAPVWAWRTLGMIRELGRKHPQHTANMLSELREDTAESRERHSVLAQSFILLEEVSGSDLTLLAC